MIGPEEKAAVLRVMENGELSGYQGNWSDSFYGGPEVQALEKEWAEYFGAKHAIACNSATSGLWMALAAIGLQLDLNNSYGKSFLNNVYDNMEFCGITGEFEGYHPPEVIVTPYSMTCSASVPLLFGAKPVFADIEKDYYCLDPKAVEAAITPHTKAIIVVDLFGQPYAADEINAIAKKHGIYVIEDAAQAIGAKYKGKFAGTLGDIGVFSLNRHKHIQCGEGGVVVTDNDKLARKLRLLMNHAEAVVNDLERQSLLELEIYDIGSISCMVGMNLRMTELSAAVSREQLKKLPGILKQVRIDANCFPVLTRPGCEHAFYRYAMSKEEIIYISDNYFNWKKHYITPIYKMPLFKALGYPEGLCPVCEEVEENIVLAWQKEPL